MATKSSEEPRVNPRVVRPHAPCASALIRAHLTAPCFTGRDRFDGIASMPMQQQALYPVSCKPGPLTLVREVRKGGNLVACDGVVCKSSA